MRTPAPMSRPTPPRLAVALAALLASALLAACGGGSSDDSATASAGGTTGGGGTSTTLSCDTTKFTPGAVAAPTAAQLSAYAGTYVGDEGQYGPNPGDPFVKSGSATVVLSAAGALTYKGTAYTVTSVCLDKAAGPFGTLLYVHTDKGHVDIADKVDPTLGNAWGVSPVDGTTIWTKGTKP